MEWARLMHLGRDEAAYREFDSWLKAFESNPKKWKRYYAWQVTMRRYEDTYGDRIVYTREGISKSKDIY